MEPVPNPPPSPFPGRQTLTTTDAVAIIVGIVVGAGIFETPPLVAANAGTPLHVVAVWVFGGVLSLLGALCHAELATTYPDSGGIYYYLKRAFGDTPAFLWAWARLAVIQTGSIALLGFVFGDYASQVFRLGNHSPSVYAALAIVIFTLLNIKGVQFGRWTQRLLSLATLAGVLSVVVAGFTLRAPQAVASTAPAATHSSLGLMMVFVLLTYGGWQEAGYISAELKDVRRAMLPALLGSIGLVTAVYVLVNVSLMHGLGLQAMANSQAVAADVMRQAVGPAGALLVSLAVVFAALSSMQGTVFTGARTNFALGRDFPMFRLLGHWEPSGETPTRALAIQGLVALLLVLLGTLTRQGFKTMVEYTAPVFWLFIFLSGVALMVLRRKEPHLERPFSTPAYPLTPILFIITSGYMLYASLAYTGLGALVGVLVLLAGFGVLAAGQGRSTHPAPAPKLDPHKRRIG